MIILSGNPYLKARVILLASRLLTPEQIEQLPQLGLEGLAEHHDLAALRNPSLPVNSRLRAFEGALIQALLSELLITIRPMYDEARELVMHWAKKFELFNLKALIRGKLIGLSDSEIQATLYSIPPYLALPHGALLRTESVLEMLRLLEGGPYASIAGQVRQAYSEHSDPGLLEAAIDQRYFSGLSDRMSLLAWADKRDVRKMVGAHLDRINIVWLLRYRFSYQLSPSETYYRLVPSPYKVSKELLLALVELPTYEEVLAALPAPLADHVAGAENAVEVDNRLSALAAEKMREILKSSPSAIARALAFLMLRDLDIKRFFTVAQASLFELDESALRMALGLRPPAPAQMAVA